MKERPILFNAEMVRAVLDGRKTQTRRPVKPQPYTVPWRDAYGNADEALFWRYAEPREDWPYPRFCQLGQPGDRLWVREAWQDTRSPGEQENRRQIMYRADDDRSLIGWRPSIHMPRWASRIILEITDVRVDQLNSISNIEIIREGIRIESCNICVHSGGSGCEHCFSLLNPFRAVWDACYGKTLHSWGANPWVWVIEFRRIKA